MWPVHFTACCVASSSVQENGCSLLYHKGQSQVSDVIINQRPFQSPWYRSFFLLLQFLSLYLSWSSYCFASDNKYHLEIIRSEWVWNRNGQWIGTIFYKMLSWQQVAKVSGWFWNISKLLMVWQQNSFTVCLLDKQLSDFTFAKDDFFKTLQLIVRLYALVLLHMIKSRNNMVLFLPFMRF